MTIKMTIEMTTEMTVEKKIIGISKSRESIEIIMKTHMTTGTTRIIIELVTKMKTKIKTKTNTEMTVLTKLEVGLKKKITYMMIEKMIVLKQNLKRVHKILQTMSKEKEIAIALMLADSENLDHIVDSIHSQADVDHLIAKRIEFAKNQKAEKLAKDQHENTSNTNSQSNANPVNCEPINLDTSLTQDLQENAESAQSFGVPTKIIEGKVDDYSVTSPHEENIQDIDIYDIAEMPNIPTRITDDQVIEEFMLEEEEIDFQGIDEYKIVKMQDVHLLKLLMNKN